MANALQWISSQCEALKDLNPNLGDKLAVEKDRFVLSPGGFSQAFTRFYFNCLKGGYNRDAVVAHFEKVWTKVDAFGRNELPNLPLPEKTHFAKKLYLLKTAAQGVGYYYRDCRDSSALGDPTCSKLSALFEKFRIASDQLNQELQLDAIDLAPIPFKMPPNQTVAQTVALAKKALVSTADKVKATALVILTVLLSPIALLLTVGKWVLWNPIEFAIRGKITTKSPLGWLFINGGRYAKINERKEWPVIQYANQLLSAPTITDEHIEGFREIVSLGKLEAVHLMTCTTQEGRPYHEPFIALPTLLKLISYLSAIPSCKRVEIPSGFALPEAQHLVVDEALRKAGFQEDAKYKGFYTRRKEKN